MKETGKAKVLIVDDERSCISILSEALKQDYILAAAKNGPSALKIVTSQKPPDLILLDITMPDMDGFEVCRRLKENPNTASIPVIFASAKSEEADEQRGLDLGAVDYVTKPYCLPIVRARVRTHVELKKKTDALERLSSLDGLTGIHSRRHFDQSLPQEWKNAVRRNKPLSLIMIDIDHFKLFNDNYGHVAGDDCLRKVASTLEQVTQRPRDVMARYGGEEFVALLPETDADGAFHVAEKMRTEVLNLGIPHALSTTADVVTLSLGLSTASPAHCSAQEILLESADQALYLAKREARNTVRAVDISSTNEGPWEPEPHIL